MRRVCWGGARGGALAAIPGAAIFSPIDEAASAAAAGIPETSMGSRHGPRPPTGGGAPGAGTAALAAADCGGGGRGRGRNCGAGGFPGWGAWNRGGAAAGARGGGGGTGGGPPARRPRPPASRHGRCCGSERLPAGWCATPEGGVQRQAEPGGPGEGGRVGRRGGPWERSGKNEVSA